MCVQSRCWKSRCEAESEIGVAMEGEAMASTGGKNWWEQDLEWSLGGSKLPELNSGVRPIPKVLTSSGLAKAPTAASKPVQSSPGNTQLETEKVESKKVAPTLPPIPQRPAPPPRPTAPPQSAASVPQPAQPVRAVTYPPPKPITAQTAKACEFTLEQLLDPDFCGYVKKDS
jgi:hypothetical protein